MLSASTYLRRRSGTRPIASPQDQSTTEMATSMPQKRQSQAA